MTQFSSGRLSAAVFRKIGADGLSMLEAARLSGLSKSSLLRVIEKSHKTDMETFITLCDWMEIHPKFFFVDGPEDTQAIIDEIAASPIQLSVKRSITTLIKSFSRV